MALDEKRKEAMTFGGLRMGIPAALGGKHIERRLDYIERKTARDGQRGAAKKEVVEMFDGLRADEMDEFAGRMAAIRHGFVRFGDYEMGDVGGSGPIERKQISDP